MLPAVTHPSLGPGDRLGPYRIEQELGRGGAGVVYVARAVSATSGPAEVAIKARLAGDDLAEARFEREIGALRSLRVPGTVRVHDVGRAGPIAWFAMDRVEGRDFRARVRAERDVAARAALAVRLGAALLEVLAGVHRRGFAHRDLKPGNVLVDAADGVWLLDFGVTRTWRTATASLTRPGTVVGTLPYMAPEQVAGHDAGPPADAFAVGLLLHEAVAGSRESARVPQEWLARQCLDRLAPLVTVAPGVDPAMSALVERLLAFDPADRPSAGAAARALRRLDAGAGPAWPPRPEPPHLHGRDELVADLARQARAAQPTVVALGGAAGSGRRRVAEQVRRQLLLRGVRGIRTRARLDDPGAPPRDVLRDLLGRAAPPDVTESEAARLRALWPDLPLPAVPAAAADRRSIAEAAAAVLVRASQGGPLVVELDGAEDIDDLTGDWLVALGRAAPTTLLVLARLDARWPGPGWQRLQLRLSEPALRTVVLPDLSGADAVALAADLGAPGAARAGSPLSAVEAAHQALAARPALPWAALPLALAPGPVSAALVSALGADPRGLVAAGWLQSDARGGLHLPRASRTSALARIGDRSEAAARLRDAADTPGLVATAAALVAPDADAHAAAVDAALHAAREGHAAEARRWLQVADTLPHPRTEAWAAGRFTRAWCRARVSLWTDGDGGQPELVAQARRRARSPEEVAEARILEEELRWRQGGARAARRALDEVAAEAAPTHPELARRARLARARLELEDGSPSAGLRALDRAAVVPGDPPAEAAALRARAAILVGDPHAALNGPAGTLEGALVAAAARHLLEDAEGARSALDLAWERLDQGEASPAARFEARLRLASFEAEDRRPQVALRLLDDGPPAGPTPRWMEGEVHATRLSAALALGRIEDGDALALEPPSPIAPAAILLVTRWWGLRGVPDHATPFIDRAEDTLPGPWARAAVDLARAWVHLRAGRADEAAECAREAAERAADARCRALARQARLVRAAARREADAAWGYVAARALQTPVRRVALLTLELDALRRELRGDTAGAADAWADVRARALRSGRRLLARTARERHVALTGAR